MNNYRRRGSLMRRFYRSGVVRTNYNMPSWETWTQHRWHHLSQHGSHELITQQTTAWQLHSSMVFTKMDALVDWRWFYSMITVWPVALWLQRSKIGRTTDSAIMMSSGSLYQYNRSSWSEQWQWTSILSMWSVMDHCLRLFAMVAMLYTECVVESGA